MSVKEELEMSPEERKRIRKIQWAKELKEYPNVPLWESGKIPLFDASFGENEPSMMSFLLPKAAKARACMLICPGGAYAYKAYIEGSPVATWLNKLDISAFVLDYRTEPYEYPCALLDAQRAIRLIRSRADEWGIDPDKIGMIGFSAGGHLTTMAANHFDEGKADAEDPIERFSCKPNLQVPCYPVISYMNRGGGSLVKNITDEVRLKLSGEQNVRPDTPPAFLWITRTDMLPYRALFDYANALHEKEVAFELHIFHEGRHGLGMADEFPDVGQWVNLCGNWLKKMGF